MPCFKGIAVSIHANGPIPEHGVVKQSRASRVTSYIPVPEPTLNPETGAQEPAKFAISITLLTKGLQIPYSTPPPTADNPNPKPRVVGAPGQNGSVGPYIPLTSSENETIAAYIYFDGRAKEEVATLLRPGEETWVNSRWVQVPESEGGGLAEREFLFREVALERWLNGLDLKGHDAADKLEKRRLKYERRQRRQEKAAAAAADENGGPRNLSPMDSESNDSSVESEDEIPEATGQIKVAMFRVLASGEIKKGEYSPQFDAHDDDDDDAAAGNQNGSGVGADVEHTTSFAKPKTLDPKTISTQTVTGIDGPDKPYATFTFFYRGKRQLEKMGVLPSSKAQATPSSVAKRRSAQIDIPKLGPLKTGGTVGFSAFRDNDADSARRRKSRKKSIAESPSTGSKALVIDSDSDADDDLIAGKMEDVDDKDIQPASSLNPEEAKFSGELADGVERIHLKRARSADPESAAANSTSNAKEETTNKTSNTNDKALLDSLPPVPSSGPGFGGSIFSKSLPDDSTVGSPLKRQRALSGPDEEKLSQAAGLGSLLAQVQAAHTGQRAQPASGLQPSAMKQDDEEEEL